MSEVKIDYLRCSMRSKGKVKQGRYSSPGSSLLCLVSYWFLRLLEAYPILRTLAGTVRGRNTIAAGAVKLLACGMKTVSRVGADEKRRLAFILFWDTVLVSRLCSRRFT